MRLGTHTRGVFAGGPGIPPHSGQCGRAVCSAVVPGLLDRRLIFVTGKGGVGKSTVATALGVLAARHGLRTIVTELASQARIRDTFGHDGDTYEEVQLSERLFTISIDPQRAMEEYLQVRTGPVGQALGATRLFQAFAMATPGMRELLSIGKIWELAQLERRTAGGHYDLVIVDSPAAGHGVGILRTPQTFADIARVGPIAHQGRTIARTIADPAFTAVIAVASAEEMPVNETLWLRDALVEASLPLDAVIVNALYPSRFTARDHKRLQKARAGSLGGPASAAVRAALSEHARVLGQHEQLQRLRDGLALPLLELPYLFAEAIGPAELDQLADALETGVAAPRGT